MVNTYYSCYNHTTMSTKIINNDIIDLCDDDLDSEDNDSTVSFPSFSSPTTSNKNQNQNQKKSIREERHKESLTTPLSSPLKSKSKAKVRRNDLDICGSSSAYGSALTSTTTTTTKTSTSKSTKQRKNKKENDWIDDILSSGGKGGKQHRNKSSITQNDSTTKDDDEEDDELIITPQRQHSNKSPLKKKLKTITCSNNTTYETSYSFNSFNKPLPFSSSSTKASTNTTMKKPNNTRSSISSILYSSDDDDDDDDDDLLLKYSVFSKKKKKQNPSFNHNNNNNNKSSSQEKQIIDILDDSDDDKVKETIPNISSTSISTTQVKQQQHSNNNDNQVIDLLDDSSASSSNEVDDDDNDDDDIIFTFAKSPTKQNKKNKKASSYDNSTGLTQTLANLNTTSSYGAATIPAITLDEDSDSDICIFKTSSTSTKVNTNKNSSSCTSSSSSGVGKSSFPNPYLTPTKSSSSTSNTSTTNNHNVQKQQQINDGLTTFADLPSPFAQYTPTHPTSTTTSTHHSVPPPLLPNDEIPITLPTSLMNEIGGKLYPDLRHTFILALYNHISQNLKSGAFQKPVFDSCVRAILTLSLQPTKGAAAAASTSSNYYPIRTLGALQSVNGVGKAMMDVIQNSKIYTDTQSNNKKKKNHPYYPKRPNQFSAIAPAVLLALLQHEEEQSSQQEQESSQQEQESTYYCPLETLLPKISAFMDYRNRTPLHAHSADYFENTSDLRDPDYAQIKKMCTEKVHSGITEPLIKQRRKKDACPSGIVFELMEEGRKMALQLRQNNNNNTNNNTNNNNVSKGPLRQLASTTCPRKYQSVCMCIDFREGGGMAGVGSNLHQMCDRLDLMKVPYLVRELKISDYIFFVGNKLAPILIERKSVDDVAASIHDGRWERQQRNMRKAQYVLGGGGNRICQICYLVEGDASQRTVNGFVGRRSWGQSEQQVEDSIALLPKLGFGVMRTLTMRQSVNVLAKIAQDVSWKFKNNSIDCTLTYQEFLERMKECDEKEGDPPTDPRHQNPSPPVVTTFTTTSKQQARAAAASTSNDNNNNNVDDDNRIFSPMHDEREAKRASLRKKSATELKQMLKDRDELTTGKKEDLVERLLKPLKPAILLLRKRQKQYVPKLDTCNSAIMVALLLNNDAGGESSGNGLTKEQLMQLAEQTGINKVPMDGDGSGWYDGWSNVKQLTSGDPALVSVRKKHYFLTTQPIGKAGVDVAKGLHIMAHREGLCRCGQYVVDTSTTTTIT